MKTATISQNGTLTVDGITYQHPALLHYAGHTVTVFSMPAEKTDSERVWRRIGVRLEDGVAYRGVVAWDVRGTTEAR